MRKADYQADTPSCVVPNDRATLGPMGSMTAEELAARVRAIKPAIAARAAVCESLRRMPDETW